VYLFIGHELLWQNRYEEAIEAFQNSLMTGCEYPAEALYQLAIAFGTLGQSQRAARMEEEALATYRDVDDELCIARDDHLTAELQKRKAEHQQIIAREKKKSQSGGN